MKRRFGGQSAMEYLLTYGWAILIIAIVLVALFQLHIFEPQPYFACLGKPGFLCSSPSLSSGGALTVNLSYNGYSYPITIIGLYCNVTSSPSSKKALPETTDITVQPGQSVPLVFECPITETKIGDTSSLFLTIFYNTPTASNLQQNFAKGVLPVTYGGSITWDVNEWTPSSNAVGMFLGYGTSASSGVYGPRNGYLYWESASPSIYSVNSFVDPNLTAINVGSFSLPSGSYKIWSSIWATNNYQELDINYTLEEHASDPSFNPATQLSQVALVINPSGTTPELDAYWIRERAYPPGGTMPTQGTFSNPSGDNSVASLQNNKGPTGPNFQQEITFNPSSNNYKSFEASDLGNIRFYIGSLATPANALYSWCESGCSKSSSTAIFWVKIPQGLASGSNSIDMEFLQPTTTEYGGYAGESPIQSVINGGSYAQYDNGASVFDFYDNFAGTSLSSKWSILEGATATVNSGLQLSGGTAYGASIYANINPANAVTGNTIIDSDYKIVQTPTTSPQNLPYSGLSPPMSTNPVPGYIPSSTTLLNSTTWESFPYGSASGWDYGTLYHYLDLYFGGTEAALFPLHQLAEDSAPCSAPFASRGYTANATFNMSGTYTFNILDDDGTQIFYSPTPANPNSWNAVFSNTGSVWPAAGQAPNDYSASVTFPKGQYDLVVDYIDICDPAGLSAVFITPSPVQST